MPTYQYECEACGYSFEKWQGIREPKLKECPKCKKRTVHRLIGMGSSLIFKGSGFYETDYKKNKKPKDNGCPLENKGKCSDSCPIKKSAKREGKESD